MITIRDDILSYREMCDARMYNFPRKGYTENIGVPPEQGVYVIYDPQKKVVHVGRTQRARRGLRQRLNNHLLGQSSFVEKYLRRKSSRLRAGYKFRYLVLDSPRNRALLEALAIGVLCPKHIGLGE